MALLKAVKTRIAASLLSSAWRVRRERKGNIMIAVWAKFRHIGSICHIEHLT
jgi:hypothetical protein